VRRLILALAATAVLVGCGGGGASTPATRSSLEPYLEYDNLCPGTVVLVNERGWSVGADPTVHPEPNTKTERTNDELRSVLQAAACPP